MFTVHCVLLCFYFPYLASLATIKIYVHTYLQTTNKNIKLMSDGSLLLVFDKIYIVAYEDNVYKDLQRNLSKPKSLTVHSCE